MTEELRDRVLELLARVRSARMHVEAFGPVDLPIADFLSLVHRLLVKIELRLEKELTNV